VPDGEAGVNEILSGNYNVVVLDSMMPKLSGLDVLKTVRQQSKTPIIMLTAKGDDIDRIIGLEMGADDYVPKPCPPRELLPMTLPADLVVAEEEPAVEEETENEHSKLRPMPRRGPEITEIG